MDWRGVLVPSPLWFYIVGERLSAPYGMRGFAFLFLKQLIDTVIVLISGAQYYSHSM